MSDMKIITMNIFRAPTYEETQYPGLNTFAIRSVPNPFTEYKLGILLNNALVICIRNSKSSEGLYLASLPAKIRKIQSKMKELEFHNIIHIFYKTL